MIWDQPTVSLVVTDSGLGGLDVAARLVRAVADQGYCRRLDLTFVDCKPSAAMGYNHLPNDATRAGVFSQALRAMAQRFEPDAVIIACNTLSAVYQWTDFARDTSLPVVSIIQPAARMVDRFLREQPSAVAALFATPVTCDARLHRRALLDRGVAEHRLLFQPCPGLAGAIDRNSHGPDTVARVDQAVAAVADRLRDKSPSTPVAACTCCTHFGYVTDLFREAFARHGIPLAGVLNPNEQLVFDLLDGAIRSGMPPKIHVQVVSQCGHTDQVKQSIGRLIEPISPQTAQALGNDICEPLFSLPDII